jgi:hypothetical protein
MTATLLLGLSKTQRLLSAPLVEHRGQPALQAQVHQDQPDQPGLLAVVLALQDQPDRLVVARVQQGPQAQVASGQLDQRALAASHLGLRISTPRIGHS